MKLVPVAGKGKHVFFKLLMLMFSREAPSLKLLEERFEKDSSGWQKLLAQSPFLVSPGSYVGPSTCNNFTSALGAGQRVLRYSYYRPSVVAKKK